MRRLLLAIAVLGATFGAAPAVAQEPVPPAPPAAPPLSDVRAEALSDLLDARMLLSDKTVSAKDYTTARDACEKLPEDDLLLVRYYNLCQGYVDLDEAEQDARDCRAIVSCSRTVSNLRKRLKYYRSVAAKLNAVLPTEVPDPECAAALRVEKAELTAIKKTETAYAKIATALRDRNEDRLSSLVSSARKIKGRPTDKQLRQRFRAGCR